VKRVFSLLNVAFAMAILDLNTVTSQLKSGGQNIFYQMMKVNESAKQG
jgi:hypothetical protein